MIANALYTSKTDEWSTPQEFYDALDAEFHFDLDVCATAENAKCAKYYTRETDGLERPWVGNVWCNPPYGKTIGLWCKKATEEIEINADVIVMLVPARTDTKWFHDYIYHKPGVEIRFVRGRIKFGGQSNDAPFPSMVVIFMKNKQEDE